MFQDFIQLYIAERVPFNLSNIYHSEIVYVAPKLFVHDCYFRSWLLSFDIGIAICKVILAPQTSKYLLYTTLFAVLVLEAAAGVV